MFWKLRRQKKYTYMFFTLFQTQLLNEKFISLITFSYSNV